MGTEWKRIQLLLTPDMVELIDDWRRQQRDLPDRNEAIRELLRRQLENEGLHSGESE